MAVDILKVKSAGEIAEIGKDVKIMVPDGSSSFTVTVRGRQSKEHIAYSRKATRKALMMMNEEKRNPNKAKAIDLDDLHDDAIGDCIVRIKKWDGIGKSDKPLECNEENIRQVIALYGDNPLDNEFIKVIKEASEELGKI